MALHRGWKQMLVLFLACTFVVCQAPAGYALKEPDQTIRVGFPIQRGLTELDKEGHCSGYSYEYLQEIAQYAGWSYEFVQIPGNINESLISMMQMLETGELDLMGGILYQDALAKKYEYAGNSYGTVYTVLAGFEDSDFLTADSTLKRTVRVAIPNNAPTREKELRQYCDINLIVPELIFCATEEDQLRALESGRADVLLNVSINPIEKVHTFVKFAPRPFYFITTKGNSGLVHQLNDAIYRIEQADPGFSSTQYKKYFSQRSSSTRFTEEETAFLAQVGTLRVGMQNKTPPFSAVDAGSGQLVGISVDLLSYIAEQTGLQFDIVQAPSREILHKLAAAHQIDLAAGLPYDYEAAQKQQFSLTRPYLNLPYTMALNRRVTAENLSGKRLALPRDLEEDEFPTEGVLRYDTLEDCMRAVAAGKADYTYGPSYAVQYYANQPDYQSVKLLTKTHEPARLCFGIVKPGNRILLSILNKVILGIPRDTLETMTLQNTTRRQRVTLYNWVLENPLPTGLVILSVLMLVIGVLLWNLRSRIRHNRRMALDLKKHLQVYALASEYFFEYDYATDRLMVSLPQSNGFRLHAGLMIRDKATVENPKESDEERANKADFFRIVRAPQDLAQEMQCHYKDGSLHWLQIISKNVQDDAGRPMYAVGKFALIDKEKEEKAHLLEQARRDSLTGLYNTSAFQEIISEHLSAMQPDECGALFILDVDHFKQINDTLGHPVGDLVLTEIAAVLQHSFRREDVIGRLGGDELIIYAVSMRSREALERKCAALCEAIRTASFASGLSTTISIGAVLVCAPASYGVLYQTADQALYQAKEHGRDRFWLAS